MWIVRTSVIMHVHVLLIGIERSNSDGKQYSTHINKITTKRTEIYGVRTQDHDMGQEQQCG